MNLFSSNNLENILPYEGEAIYYGPIFSIQKSQLYFDLLMKNVCWENDKIILFGKEIVTKRKVAWYGNEPFAYTYSKNTKYALPWTPELLELKKITEETTGSTYNSCLLNLYHSGEEGMAWHSDDEKELKPYGSIASISLGACRKFLFKNKANKETISVMLEHGSLLEMKGKTQSYWLHKLPPTKKVKTPRINLTFRSIEKNSNQDNKKTNQGKF